MHLGTSQEIWRRHYRTQSKNTMTYSSRQVLRSEDSYPISHSDTPTLRTIFFKILRWWRWTLLDIFLTNNISTCSYNSNLIDSVLVVRWTCSILKNSGLQMPCDTILGRVRTAGGCVCGLSQFIHHSFPLCIFWKCLISHMLQISTLCWNSYHVFISSVILRLTSIEPDTSSQVTTVSQK